MRITCWLWLGSTAGVAWFGPGSLFWLCPPSAALSCAGGVAGRVWAAALKYIPARTRMAQHPTSCSREGRNINAQRRRKNSMGRNKLDKGILLWASLKGAKITGYAVYEGELLLVNKNRWLF